MSQTNTISLEDCWLFAGSISRNGYGRFGHYENGKDHTIIAHRIMYENMIGHIPNGLVIDHLCRVRRCINPKHLEIVTSRENLLRGETLAAKNAAKTHCLRGHEYDSYYKSKYRRGGARYCKSCVTQYSREYYQRNKKQSS